jgi:uncharacterized protein YneF (UPF0154 family)
MCWLWVTLALVVGWFVGYWFAAMDSKSNPHP